MTSDIVSVEIGRSTWQGPAEEAPQLAHITRDDLVSALEQIEILTATGSGLDPDTTMQIHLLAGIGRATHDPYAWYSRADLCASGQQVRALEWDEYSPGCFFGKGECGDYSIAMSASCFHEGEFRLSGVEGDFSYFDTAESAKAAAQADYERRILAALTPAPQAEGEAVPVALVATERKYGGQHIRFADESALFLLEANELYGEGGYEVTPLYVHPPQPSETVAEALKLAAARLQRLALEIPSTTSLRAEAFEWAEAALRAMKGGSDG